MTEQNPVPAATVAVLRASPRDRELEVLLLRRNARLVFLGGHWVFPGGRLDPEDFASAPRKLEYPAARRAAVRETLEEAGIELDNSRLIHTAHWTTPPNLPRRFSTWFFVYPLRNPVSVRVDNREILDYQWLSPRLAIARAEAGELNLAQPTRATLEDLLPHRSLPELEASLESGTIRVFPANSPYYRPREMGCDHARDQDCE